VHMQVVFGPRTDAHGCSDKSDSLVSTRPTSDERHYRVFEICSIMFLPGGSFYAGEVHLDLSRSTDPQSSIHRPSVKLTSNKRTENTILQFVPDGGVV